MELGNLQSIFKKRFFRIPDYQRGYSWGKKQLDDMWRDIDSLPDEQDHYTGMLAVVLPKNSHEDPNIPANMLVSVVDGQQRITTLIILINVILNSDALAEREFINGKRKDDYQKKYLFVQMGKQRSIVKSVFGYDKDNPSHVYFEKKILGLNVSDNVPSRTLYTRNLDTAHKFFTDKVEGMPFDKLEVVLRKITEQLRFNYYEINNDINEFVAFEAMNNRGKPLSDLELLKNQLIYLSTLLPSENNEKNELRKGINDAWKTIYEYLGKGEKPLDDNEFLKTHWIMYFGYGGRGKAKVYKEFLLNKHFTVNAVRNKDINLLDIQAYVRDIQRAVRSYFFLYNPQHSECQDRHSVKVRRWLAKLNRLGYFAFSPLVTSILTKRVDDSIVVKTLEAAERFNFVAFRVRFEQRNKKNSHIYRCAHEFHTAENEELTLDKVQEKLTLEGELNISNEVSRDHFYKEVIDYEYGFYDWWGLNYFLYEYEIDLQKDAQGEEKVAWESAINDETIEHIYPQTPANGWDGLFVSDEKQHPLLHDLGNLLLLSHSLNSKISNGPFTKKSEVFSTNSYSAIEVSRCSEWTPEVVKKRREKMLKFLWRRWGLQEPKE